MNLQSFKNTCPIIHFQDNLIFNDTGECWGLYRIKNFDYELRKTEEKMSMLYSLSNFIAEAGEQMKLLVIPRVSNNSEKMMNLINRMQKLNMEDEIKIMAKKTVEKQAEYLIEKDEGGVNEYETYLLINLKPKMEVLNFLKGIFTNPKEHLYEFFGVDTFEISKAKLEEYKVRNKDFLRRQLGRVIVQPVDEPEQIEYLIRRAFYRGLRQMLKLGKAGSLQLLIKEKSLNHSQKILQLYVMANLKLKTKL